MDNCVTIIAIWLTFKFADKWYTKLIHVECCNKSLLNCERWCFPLVKTMAMTWVCILPIKCYCPLYKNKKIPI